MMATLAFNELILRIIGLFTPKMLGVIMHYLYVLIILFNTGLNKSKISIYSFGKLVFLLSAFSVRSVFRFYLHKLYNIYIIIVHVGVRYSVILSSLY